MRRAGAVAGFALLAILAVGSTEATARNDIAGAQNGRFLVTYVTPRTSDEQILVKLIKESG